MVISSSGGKISLTRSHGLDVGRRRDVQGLISVLEELKSGMHVGATFKSDDYGIHRVDGVAVLSGGGSFLVGGQPLDGGPRPGAARKPVPSLRALSLGIAVRDEETVTVPEEEITNDSIAHGDLVRATFVQSPYGEFSITGVTVWAPVGNVFVVGGGWFVTRQSGQQATRLKQLVVLVRSGDHQQPVPPQLRSWPSSDDSETG